ncbi:MAG: hydroxyacylglutathione hydrolase [Gammaproteobacteria bacterium]
MKNIIPIKAFNDNYIWVFADTAPDAVWVVDPGDAAPVLSYLKKQNLRLAGILITHHHPDHSGGVAELLKVFNHIPVYGSVNSKVPLISHFVKEGDEIVCGEQTLNILEIPGHTLDHTAFYNDEILFCGDTLFSAGCGRVFEGTHEQMYASLKKLAQLPLTTKIYCGHEYTLANLKFAEHVEPENTFIRDKISELTKKVAENQATLPSVLGDEKKMNPFLRCEIDTVIQAASKQAGEQLSDPVAVFASIREWKNQF